MIFSLKTLKVFTDLSEVSTLRAGCGSETSLYLIIPSGFAAITSNYI